MSPLALLVTELDWTSLWAIDILLMVLQHTQLLQIENTVQYNILPVYIV